MHAIVRRAVRPGIRAYPCRGGTLLLDITESPMMLARVLRRYERHTVRALRTFLTSGSTFLDIGANKGDFTILGASLVGPAGLVVAIEPERENFEVLRRAITINRVNQVRAVRVALTNYTGDTTLFLGKYSGWHSLKLGPAASYGKQTVPARRCDDVLRELGVNAVDVMKIDVEGAELEVLQGATETLARGKTTILLDFHRAHGVHPNELQALLNELGYAAFETAPPYKALPGLTDQTREALFRPMEPSRSTDSEFSRHLAGAGRHL